MDYSLPNPFGSDSHPSVPAAGKDLALIIEDHEDITGLLRILLAKCGLRAVCAQNGQEALAAFARHREQIALVLSDCRLPDCDGRAICQRLREQQPDLPLLMSSGSATFLNLGPIVSGKLVRFMPKPYMPAEVLDHVRKLQAAAHKVPVEISAGFV